MTFCTGTYGADEADRFCGSRYRLLVSFQKRWEKQRNDTQNTANIYIGAVATVFFIVMKSRLIGLGYLFSGVFNDTFFYVTLSAYESPNVAYW